MGLHINYWLQLPGDTTENDALARLEQLRIRAEAIAPERVTPLVRLTGEEVAVDLDSLEPCTLERFLVVAAENVVPNRDVAAAFGSEPYSLAVAAFVMNPGEGSESAFFGLVRSHSGGPWRWEHYCKTQYASIVSDEHLVQCHLAVVRVLEAAKELGFAVEVLDETHYWETRSTDRLIAEVHRMNQIVARVAGAFSDAAASAHDIKAEIFAHPEFEHLEMEELNDLPGAPNAT